MLCLRYSVPYLPQTRESTKLFSKRPNNVVVRSLFLKSYVLTSFFIKHLVSVSVGFSPVVFEFKVCAARGPRPRYPRVWKTRKRIGSISKAAKMIACVMLSFNTFNLFICFCVLQSLLKIMVKSSFHSNCLMNLVICR